MKKIVWISFMIFLVNGLFGQSQLDKYLQMAAEQNPKLKSKYSSYLASLERVNQQGVLPDPTLSFGYFISPVETRVGTQRMKFSISQMFPWMGTNKVKKQAATSLAKMNFEEFQAEKNELFYKVKLKWLSIYELRSEISTIREQLDILKAFENITRAKYEANKVSLSELVRVQISIENTTTSIELSELRIKVLSADFNTLLNRDAERIVLVTDALQATNTTFEFDSAFMAMPEVQVLNSQLAFLENESVLTDLKKKPGIGVGLDYGVVNKRSDIPVPDNGKDILMPMVSVSLPIFGNKNKHRKKEIELKTDGVEYELEGLRAELKNDWVNADHELTIATEQIRQTNSEIEQTELLMRLLATEYSNDNGDFEELLNAYQKLLDLKLELINAQCDFQRGNYKKEYLNATSLKKEE